MSLLPDRVRTMTDSGPRGLDRWGARWIRTDAAALFVVTLCACVAMHVSWTWFLVLFLVPDVSMIGYVFGPRAGAVMYNTAHLYAWPAGLLATGLVFHTSWATTAALTWIAHVSFDNVMGYGLKLPTGFEHTIYGSIGKARVRT